MRATWLLQVFARAIPACTYLEFDRLRSEDIAALLACWRGSSPQCRKPSAFANPSKYRRSPRTEMPPARNALLASFLASSIAVILAAFPEISARGDSDSLP